MAESETRLRNLLREELDDCCAADVERRLDELDALAERAVAPETRSVFAVLGNETRYRLARALTLAEGELCVCELEQVVDVSESAVSHGLADLVDAGLATRRKDGNWRYYESTPLAAALFATADSRVTEA